MLVTASTKIFLIHVVYLKRSEVVLCVIALGFLPFTGSMGRL